MRIGVPKEIKTDEQRVALTPAGAELLVRSGHSVRIEAGAGEGSGFPDAAYLSSGAEVVTRELVWSEAELVLKVKEPLMEEYRYFREGLLLFTYLHLAAEPELARALVSSKMTAVAYETVQADDGSLPLLVPMSEVAGRMAVQIGAACLEKRSGGRGVLLGGVPGVRPCDTVIIGGGVVGTSAAKIAIGLGSRTTIFDKDLKRLRQLEELFQGKAATLYPTPSAIHDAVAEADLLIGAVLVPGVRAPRLVGEDSVKRMKPGSVIVDVAIDQGGSIETIDRVTTHSNPTYVKHGVVHYSVANMPGAVPCTSTMALTNATLPYAMELAAGGVDALLSGTAPKALIRGVNVLEGRIVHPGVAEAMEQTTKLFN